MPFNKHALALIESGESMAVKKKKTKTKKEPASLLVFKPSDLYVDYDEDGVVYAIPKLIYDKKQKLGRAFLIEGEQDLDPIGAGMFESIEDANSIINRLHNKGATVRRF